MLVDMARGKENPKEGKLEEGSCRYRAAKFSSRPSRLFKVKEYT